MIVKNSLSASPANNQLGDFLFLAHYCAAAMEAEERAGKETVSQTRPYTSAELCSSMTLREMLDVREFYASIPYYMCMFTWDLLKVFMTNELNMVWR